VNRFRIAITLVEATKVGLAALLGLASTQPPIYQAPPALVAMCVVGIAFLGVVSAQMPSWSQAPEAAATLKKEGTG
jgi:hypothetical protein